MCQCPLLAEVAAQCHRLLDSRRANKYNAPRSAEVAELADAADSKSVVRKDLWVRFPPSAQAKLGHVTKSRNLTPIGSLMDAVHSGASTKSGRGIDRETWRRLLGNRLASKSEPERLQGGVLTIVVASSVWAQELSLLGPEILERVRSAGIAVDTLRWRVGRPQSASRPAPSKPRVVPVRQLPAELNEALRRIGDIELRAAISTAAAHVLGRQELIRNRAASAAQPGARGPRSVEPKISPQARGERGTRAELPRTHAKRRD